MNRPPPGLRPSLLGVSCLLLLFAGCTCGDPGGDLVDAGPADAGPTDAGADDGGAPDP